MKVDFKYPHDQKRHRFCIDCHSEDVKDIDLDGKRYYKCGSCGHKNERLFDLDPEINWWIDDSTHELWHKSVGVFLLDENGSILLLARSIYPYGYTIPAGHSGKEESAEAAVVRETYEETGLEIKSLEMIAVEEPLEEDCRKGSDFHLWNLYKASIDSKSKVQVDKAEASNFRWFVPNQLSNLDLTKPTKHFWEKYSSKIVL